MADQQSGKGEPELPHLDFSTFVLGIIGTAFVHLGDAPPPDGTDLEPDLELASQNIELLELLHAKTHGNLTGEEERLLDQGLYDLKSRYAEVAKSATPKKP